MLRLSNFEALFEVHTNVSDKAIGEVLVQENHLVAFKSRKLNFAEQRYSTHEEMVVVIHCLKLWLVYLSGTRFVVRTNNVANTYSGIKLLKHSLYNPRSLLVSFPLVPHAGPTSLVCGT